MVEGTVAQEYLLATLGEKGNCRRQYRCAHAWWLPGCWICC